MVRPGTLSAIKPNVIRKKSLDAANKIQTTLNFTKVPRKESPIPKLINTEEKLELENKQLQKPKSLLSSREQTKLALTPRGTLKIVTTREETKTPPQPKTPSTPKSGAIQIFPETPKSSLKASNETRKRVLNRSQSSLEKVSYYIISAEHCHLICFPFRAMSADCFIMTTG